MLCQFTQQTKTPLKQYVFEVMDAVLMGGREHMRVLGRPIKTTAPSISVPTISRSFARGKNPGYSGMFEMTLKSGLDNELLVKVIFDRQVPGCAVEIYGNNQAAAAHLCDCVKRAFQREFTEILLQEAV